MRSGCYFTAFNWLVQLNNIRCHNGTSNRLFPSIQTTIWEWGHSSNWWHLLSKMVHAERNVFTIIGYSSSFLHALRIAQSNCCFTRWTEQNQCVVNLIPECCVGCDNYTYIYETPKKSGGQVKVSCPTGIWVLRISSSLMSADGLLRHWRRLTYNMNALQFMRWGRFWSHGLMQTKLDPSTFLPRLFGLPLFQKRYDQYCWLYDSPRTCSCGTNHGCAPTAVIPGAPTSISYTFKLPLIRSFWEDYLVPFIYLHEGASIRGLGVPIRPTPLRICLLGSSRNSSQMTQYRGPHSCKLCVDCDKWKYLIGIKILPPESSC